MDRTFLSFPRLLLLRAPFSIFFLHQSKSMSSILSSFWKSWHLGVFSFASRIVCRKKINFFWRKFCFLSTWGGWGDPLFWEFYHHRVLTAAFKSKYFPYFERWDTKFLRKHFFLRNGSSSLLIFCANCIMMFILPYIYSWKWDNGLNISGLILDLRYFNLDSYFLQTFHYIFPANSRLQLQTSSLYLEALLLSCDLFYRCSSVKLTIWLVVCSRKRK